MKYQQKYIFPNLSGGKTKKLDTNEVDVTNCHKGTCKLRRKTDVGIVLRFTPGNLLQNCSIQIPFTTNNVYFAEENISELTTTVYANILGLPLPFIGVDGTSACGKMFLADGETKTSCPLKAGQEYIYKNSFPVLELYPKLTLVVHWALTSNAKDIVCFELPAKIL